MVAAEAEAEAAEEVVATLRSPRREDREAEAPPLASLPTWQRVFPPDDDDDDDAGDMGDAPIEGAVPATVLEGFTAEAEVELSVQRGDRVWLLPTHADPGWAEVTTAAGDASGLVPSAYLEAEARL